MTGADLIAAERQRQIEVEGYDAAHDAGQSDRLALAAACYAQAADERLGPDADGTPIDWPWSAEAWKPEPHDRIRELVKAGALIAAAIDALSEAKGGN